VDLGRIFLGLSVKEENSLPAALASWTIQKSSTGLLMCVVLSWHFMVIHSPFPATKENIKYNKQHPCLQQFTFIMPHNRTL
jgi:hypothetical protein